MIKSSFRLNESYLIINLIFVVIIGLIIAYSAVFSAEKNNYIIKSACVEIADKPCKSIGLSRSFSEIVRFRFASAEKYNPNGIKLFLFFILQMIFRIIFSAFFVKFNSYKNLIISIDIILSILLFLLTFADFLPFWKLK